MRKIVSLAILFFSCISLVGCTISDNKIETLSCDKSKYNSNIYYVETQELSFQASKIVGYKLILKFDLNYLASNEEAFKEATDKIRLEYSKAVEPGVQTDVYPEGTNIVAMFTINPEIFDGFLDYNNYDMKKIFDARISLESLKIEMEKEGYTCNTK